MSDEINFQSDFNGLISIGKFKNKIIYYDEKSDKLLYSWQDDASFSSGYLSFIIFYHLLIFFNDNVIVESIFGKIAIYIASTIAGLIFFYNSAKNERASVKLRPFFIEFHDQDELLKFLRKSRKNNLSVIIIILGILVILSIISFYWYITSYKMMIPLFFSSDILVLTIVLLSCFRRINNKKIIKYTKIRNRVIDDMIKRTEYLMSIRVS